MPDQSCGSSVGSDGVRPKSAISRGRKAERVATILTHPHNENLRSARKSSIFASLTGPSWTRYPEIFRALRQALKL
jgi:hypothetical protein